MFVFPNHMCVIYMYFDRSQEVRNDCAQFWNSPSQLQMEVFKDMVIAGYRYSTKVLVSKVGVDWWDFCQSDIEPCGDEIWSVGMWKVPALCEAQYCDLSGKMNVPSNLCCHWIWQIACIKCTKIHYLVWKTVSRPEAIRILGGVQHCFGPTGSIWKWQKWWVE